MIEMSKVVSDEIGIPQRVVMEAYYSYWKFMKETIGAFEPTDIDDEKMMSTITNSFNIKHIGKLQTNFKTISSINKKIREKNENTEY
jgi:hypothetical protein